MKKILVATLAAAAVIVLAGCTETNADQADANLITAAENFEVQRTIVGISGNDGSTIFFAEGRCSFEYPSSRRVDVVCKYGPDEFRKHVFILGDRDSLIVTQEEAIDVSEFHTRIILKPQSLVPDVDISVGAP